MKFKSEYFETVEDLIAIKGTMEADHRQRRYRRRIIRQFSNGLATMSEEDAKASGNSEIVNHLTTFKFLSQRKQRFEQSFTTTRTFVEIKVDTDNPEWDSLTSIRMTQAFNRGCMYHRDGVMRNFVKATAGEIQISGGVPVVRHKRGSWQPKLAINMLFPKKCGMTASEVPYAQAPEEFTLADLESILPKIKGDGVSVSRKAVEALIAALKKKPKGESPMSGGSNINLHQTEKEGSALEESDSNRNATVDVWWHFEVKTRGDGTQYVSGTMFNQEINLSGDNKDGNVGPQIIAYFEKLFNSPEEWLNLICMDMEIGGDTTLDSVRGIAEIMYPSASEIEILLNLMLAGDKERARPKYQVTSAAASDDILNWDTENDSIVPAGVAAFDMKGSSSQLLTPFQLLMGTAAGFGGGEISNTRQGGELRQQAVGRQRSDAVMQFGDMADWTVQFESLALTMVEAVFTGGMREGCRGYHQAMWVRTCMKAYGIPLEKLFLKKHGMLKYVSVRVRRVLGEGGFDSENSAADFLLGLRPMLPPQNRARVLQLAIATKTQDPDLAESLVQIPQPIINAQKLTAENECDTIFRRALLGQPFTTNSDDVDMDHVLVHLQDLIAKLSKHQLRQWDKMDVIEFAALQRHTQDHFENALGDEQVRDEMLALLPQFQQIVQTAQKIVAEVEQQQGQAVNEQQLTQMEQEQIKLKTLELQLKAQKLGVDIENNQSLERQRLARMQQTSRQGFVRELGEAARLSMERRKMAAAEAQQAAAIAKIQAETEALKNPPPVKAK